MNKVLTFNLVNYLSRILLHFHH